MLTFQRFRDPSNHNIWHGRLPSQHSGQYNIIFDIIKTRLASDFTKVIIRRYIYFCTASILVPERAYIMGCHTNKGGRPSLCKSRQNDAIAASANINSDFITHAL